MWEGGGSARSSEGRPRGAGGGSATLEGVEGGSATLEGGEEAAAQLWRALKAAAQLWRAARRRQRGYTPVGGEEAAARLRSGRGGGGSAAMEGREEAVARF